VTVIDFQEPRVVSTFVAGMGIETASYY
jgi:hypothetical protein